MKSTLWTFTLLINFLVFQIIAVSLAQAQVMLPSFNVIGEIEAFTLDNPADPATGATITVSGTPIKIPSNMLITMPGKYNTPHDLFLEWTSETTSVVRAESGLAMIDTAPRSDVPPRITAFEAEIIGNITGGMYVATVVHISQGALHTGSGFIQSINLTTGEMRIGDPGGTVGARVILNDMLGVYGYQNYAAAKAVLKLDRRFELDPENSPVHAKTGFPVCVPRSAIDLQCPASNRPAAAAANHFRFTCGPVAVVARPADPLAPIHPGCDPMKAIPLQVGDYITYVGIIQKDPTIPGPGGFLISAYGLDAEIGVYTSPGTEPVYVFVEEALQGTKGAPFVGIPQEETTRFRIVGFSTDPTRPIEIKLVDSDRPGPSFTVTTIPGRKGFSISGPVGLMPSNGPQLGRFRDTWPSKDSARAVRRDIEVSVVGSPHAPAGPLNKLISGFYTAPMGEYIYPEVTAFGSPGFPSPVPAENFCFLFNAGGTFVDEQGTLILFSPPVPFSLSGNLTPEPTGTGGATVCTGQ
jgi:hypothetical protein